MYRTLADHLADVVLVMENELITWVSPSALHVLGYRPADLIGRSAPSLIHPDDMRDLIVTPAAPTMTGTSRMSTAGGSYKWIEFRLMARFADDGSVLAVYSILRDISDRVRLEELVDAERRRQRLALDASPDGFCIFQAVPVPGELTPSFVLEFINAAGAAGFEGNPGSLVGQDLLEFFPVAAGNGIRTDMLAALRTGLPQRSWITTTTEGGDPRELFTVQARLDDHSIVSTWRDVTEQVSHEKRLAHAQAETDAARATLHAALNATSDGFVVFGIERDPDSVTTGLRVIHANNAATAHFTLTAGELVSVESGRTRSLLAAGDLWNRIMATAQSHELAHHRTHLPGEGSDWTASFDNTIAPDGPDRVVLTFRDATDDERSRRDLDVTRRQAEYAASHDDLTGLPNRALLLHELEIALAECEAGEQVGVVFCDLDGFKSINDTHGHETGDLVLQVVARRLQTILRVHDTAGRLAGDEFVVILRHLREGWSASDFVRRVSASLSEAIVAGGLTLAPAASLGVILADPHLRPETDRSPSTVLAAADRAMYRTKAGRRSTGSG